MFKCSFRTEEINYILLKHLEPGGSTVSNSWQLCFSLKLSFLEAHPFSEILSRLDTNSSADFYLSISLIYFLFLCSGGRECPFQVWVAFSVNYEFMLFVQHLAERALHSHLGLSGITAVLWESCCSGNITGVQSLGQAGGSMRFQVSLASRQHWWSDPECQSFSIARGEEEALRWASSPVRTGERWEWAAGKHHTGMLALGGTSSRTDISHPVWARGPSYIKQNQCSGGCILVYGCCCVGLIGKLFWDSLNMKSVKRKVIES